MSSRKTLTWTGRGFFFFFLFFCHRFGAFGRRRSRRPKQVGSFSLSPFLSLMRKQWKRKAENEGGCCRPCLWGKWANLVEHARSALFTLIGVYSFAKVKEPQSGSQTSKKSPPVLFSPAPVIAATPLQRIYIYKCKEMFIKTSRNEVKGRKKKYSVSTPTANGRRKWRKREM